MELLGAHRDENSRQVCTRCWVAGDLDPVQVHCIPQSLLHSEGPLWLNLERVISTWPHMLGLRQVLATQPQLLA